ncbi:hypothetical protein BJX63DRAFT_442901 [Aspergillus granulosus]|uniref:Azaphilone pigments biosynthesis cluster protein L N-terminal domain-containing protein n=1 Tax=Aspergillus granulosus TaxID=176169 RepID=A0ABR4HDW1_9EURO
MATTNCSIPVTDWTNPNNKDNVNASTAIQKPALRSQDTYLLAKLAIQRSNSLCNMIKGSWAHPKRVRDLLEELEALNEALGRLIHALSARDHIDLSTLNRPLLRCGEACNEFEREISKCLSLSREFSVRDWAKLKYMGGDICDFTRLLGGYKLTIYIALIDGNLGKHIVSAESLISYTDLINTAILDVEDHLEIINEKLETMQGKPVTGSDLNAIELRRERDECLQIYSQLSTRIILIQSSQPNGGASPGQTEPDSLPEKLVSESLQKCKEIHALTAEKLRRHTKDIADQILTKFQTATASEDDITSLASLQDEIEATRRCIDICLEADSHLKKEFSTVDKYATDESMKFMVSTVENTFHAENQELGWRSRQIGGHLSDDSVQQLLRHFTTIGVESFHVENPSSQAKKSSVTESDFVRRYGRGYRLKP